MNTEIQLYNIFRLDLKLDDDRAKYFVEVLMKFTDEVVRRHTPEFKQQILDLKYEIKDQILKIDMKLERINANLESLKQVHKTDLEQRARNRLS